MIPSPRRTASFQPPPTAASDELDDDDGWQDMPVVRSDDNPFGLDEDDQKRFHYRPPPRLDSAQPVSGPSNATGAHLEVEADTLWSDSWRQKQEQDESDYTRLRLDEDEESEAVHMRTRYLFDEDKAMTPLSQMQATKELLTEGQRIAYVGLCALVGKGMVRDAGRGWEGWKAKTGIKAIGKGKGKEEGPPVVESARVWLLKIMARLYQHMELERDEQRMIESLAEHGVDPSDLVPALMTTHTVKNPEFDPAAKKRMEMEELERIQEETEEADEYERGQGVPPPPYERIEGGSSTTEPEPISRTPSPPLPPRSKAIAEPPVPRAKSINPFGSDEEEEDDEPPTPTASSSKLPPLSAAIRPQPARLSSFDMGIGDDDEGDLGRIVSPMPDIASPRSGSRVRSSSPAGGAEDIGQTEDTARASSAVVSPGKASTEEADPKATQDDSYSVDEKTVEEKEGELPPEALPSLPGVSISISNTDEDVTLDIRWTVLCDSFLVLIADSVYDARSRHFLERVAIALGFDWMDVVRFENRVTDALEIEEGIEKTEHGEIIEGRRKGALRKRYAMMGLAAVGGGLVIGLSAGLLAPVIGAGLGAAFATVGISGTGGFLAGAGGAAMITTGGVLTGANIAGQGMARRTREVRTFEFRPLHNNKRVTCYITMGGFMASKVDDVRLPFSVLDPIIGDVFSVLWEPEMMSEMGSALKILTSEILTQVGQQVLQATVMTALMSALQWPIILTKLGYLIDNPWSNALDRARAAGLVLADTIIHRHAGVRPVSLIGFSLGARAIFYALVELARCKAYGLVQDVFLFGATVTASKQTWLEVRSAVGGRFVNAFATNDWMLGYLFRATSGGLNTVAGLRPVDVTPGLENVDCTDIITGHMSYRSLMPQLLAKVGLPVTADYFDEPDDPEVDMSVQKRTVVNEADEEAAKNRKKILGLFPRKSSSRSASGTTTPNPDATRSAGSTDKARSPNPAAGYDEDDDDDLPPREVEDSADLGSRMPGAGESETSLDKAEEETLQAIPKTAGFDFGAISRELGKDIDVDRLKEPTPRHAPSRPADITRELLERSGSAPPPSAAAVSIMVQSPEGEARDARPSGSIARSASYALPASGAMQDEDEDGGDIAATAVKQMSLGGEMPSWDRPSTSPLPSTARISPPLPVSNNNRSQPSWSGFNAWSSGSSFVPSMRAAPPARPHPPELMANPFAAGVGSDVPGLGAGGSGLAEWERKREKEEELAETNPW